MTVFNSETGAGMVNLDFSAREHEARVLISLKKKKKKSLQSFGLKQMQPNWMKFCWTRTFWASSFSTCNTKLPLPVTGVRTVLQNGVKRKHGKRKHWIISLTAEVPQREQPAIHSFRIRPKQLLERFNGLPACVSRPHHRFCLNMLLSVQTGLLQIKMSFQTGIATRELWNLKAIICRETEAPILFTCLLPAGCTGFHLLQATQPKLQPRFANWMLLWIEATLHQAQIFLPLKCSLRFNKVVWVGLNEAICLHKLDLFERKSIAESRGGYSKRT